MKKIILVIVIIFLIGFGIYFAKFRKPAPSLILAEVVRGNISQEVSESGQVEAEEKINLSFKNAGRIEEIYVKVGDKVVTGQKLIKLDTTQLSLQLTEAEANVDAQKAKLTELQRGTRAEEIQVSQTSLDKAKSDLGNLYNDVSATLNQAYNLADSGIRQQIAALFLYRAEASTPYYDLTYKYCDSQAGIDAAIQRKTMEDKLNIWRVELQNLSNSQEKLDEAIAKAEDYLRAFQGFLNRLNDTLTTDCKLEQTDITKINTYKLAVNTAVTNVNTALTSVFSQRKAIEAQKLVVQNYQDQLNLKLAGSTVEQINYQKALLEQAEAGVALLQNQIQEAILKSPTKGEIAKINKKVKEFVQIGEPAISFIPESPFQIKVDIYEEDIVNVKVGNPVDIKLTALPEKILKGKVIAIDPTEKLIDEVVYYEVTIDFEELPQGIKPGMTADIVIKTASKDDVLIIPGGTIQKKDGKSIVQVSENGKIKDREIETGLQGSDNMVEVISGLQEGEKVILSK